MLKRIIVALESIAESLDSIATNIKYLKEEQERMIEKAEQTKNNLPQHFQEIFSVAKKFLNGGIKDGE